LQAFIATGTNLQLVFNPVSSGYPADMRDCDFDREHGKVSTKLYLQLYRSSVAIQFLEGSKNLKSEMRKINKVIKAQKVHYEIRQGLVINLKLAPPGTARKSLKV